MTTFQDPPLQSRRAVRQNERDGQPSSASTPTGPTGLPPEPLTYATTQRPPVPEYDGPSFRAHRTPDAAQPVDNAENADGAYRPRDFSPEGRRAANPTWAPQYGGVTDDGAIEFHTQARSDVPVSTKAASDNAVSDTAVDAAGAPPAAAAPARAMPQPLPVEDEQIDAIEQTLTRRELRALRDAHGISAVTTGEALLPEAQTAPAPAAPAPDAPAPDAPAAQDFAVAAALSAPPVVPAPVAPAPAPSSRLDSALAEFDALAGSRAPSAEPHAPAPRGRRAAPQTAPVPEVAQQAAPAPTSPEPVAPAAEVQAPVAPIPLVDPLAQPPVPEQVAHEFEAPAPAQVVAAPVAPEQFAPEPVAPEAVAPEQFAPEPVAPEFVAPELVAPQQSAAPAPQPQTFEAPVDGLSAFDALFTPPSAADQVVEATIEPEPVAQVPAAAEAAPFDVVAAEVVPEPVAQAPVEQASVEQAPVAQAPAPELPANVVVDPTVAAPPVGHWSTQADLDDETQFGSATLAGSVGASGAPLTTSALVLPSMPDHQYGPLASGDVILTGSISLPQTFSATGAHPAQLDQSDMDHALDPGDHQVAATDSSPVRAIRAVSTHTSSHNVMGTVKPKGNRALTVLIVAASSMAAVVVALLIVGMVSGQL